MQSKGISKTEVLKKLKQAKQLDQEYGTGRILCSMCTSPHPIAQKAYNMFLDSNLGDAGLFVGSAQLEKEVIAQLAKLLNGEGSVGFLVSGGTEANLMALWAAKNMAKKSHPEVVLPESTHFSFTKICNMLNLKPVYTKLDRNFRADASDVEKNVTENTVAIVGTAGTAELGAVDPIDQLDDVACRKGVYLHVDAAFGGLVLPFMEGRKISFDFSLKGVESITVDPHKMGMAAIPTGGILFKHANAIETLKTQTPYLTTDYQISFVGTRTGASSASAWAVLNHLGVSGYRKIVSDCIHTTRLLVDGVKKAGLRLVVEPSLNIAVFQGKKTKLLAAKLAEMGWFVSYVPRYDCIRVVVMPHVKRVHVEAFLEDLSKIEESLDGLL